MSVIYFINCASRFLFGSQQFFQHKAVAHDYSIKILREIDRMNCKSLTASQKNEVLHFYRQFGIKHIQTYWHQYYTHISGTFSPHYIPEGFFYDILSNGRRFRKLEINIGKIG